MQHNNRVLYREGLHIFMITRLIKLVLTKQTKNTLNYLRTGPNGDAITTRHQESIKLRNSRPVQQLHKKAAHDF